MGWKKKVSTNIPEKTVYISVSFTMLSHDIFADFSLFRLSFITKTMFIHLLVSSLFQRNSKHLKNMYK